MSQKAGHHPIDETESGWLRTVHAHVQYNASSALPYAWRSTGPQKYFLGQDLVLMEGTRSLKEIAEELAIQRTSSEVLSTEALQELDTIAQGLVSTVRRLHEEQRQLGIVTRDNVVWNGQQILLLDQGFYVPPNVYPQPPWISDPPPDAQLWENNIATQQAKALPNPGFAPANDVRLLIRLFQGLLLNVWQASLVTGPELRNVHRTRSMDLWDNFRKLTRPSPPPSLDELQEALEAHPLSAHFQLGGGGGGGGRGPKGPSVLWLLLPVVLAGGLGATWQLQMWPFARPTQEPPIPPPPPGQDRDGGEPGPVAELMIPDPLKIIDGSGSMTAQLDSLAEQVTALESVNDRLANENSSVAEGDQNKIATYREQFLEQWSVSFPAALEALRREETRAEGYETLIALRNHLLKVRQLTRLPSNDTVNNKERQCLELLQTLRFDPRLPKSFRQSLSQ